MACSPKAVQGEKLLFGAVRLYRLGTPSIIVRSIPKVCPCCRARLLRQYQCLEGGASDLSRSEMPTSSIKLECGKACV